MGDLRVFLPAAELDAVDIHADLLAAADGMIADLPKMTGFALVCWSQEGHTTSHYRNGAHSTIPSALIPALVAEVLRARIVQNRLIDTIQGI
jgi:hypothetical protein